MKKIFINEDKEIFAIHEINQDITYPFSLMLITEKECVLGEKFIADYDDMLGTLRFLRNEKITETDWILVNDLNLQNKDEIIEYRNALRDVTGLYPDLDSFKNGFILPEKVIPIFKETTNEEMVVISKGFLPLSPMPFHPGPEVFPGKLFVYNYGDYLYLRYADGTYVKIK